MDAGLPFRNFESGLPQLHIQNLHRLWLLNQCDPADIVRRKQLLKEAVPNAGEDFHAQSPFHCDYGFNIYTGKNVFLNFNCVILDVGKVTFGDNVLVGPNVAIYAVAHPIHPEPRVVGKLDYGQDVIVGSNVWIGGNSVINPGVHIGDNTVIGSGSVVTRDIPSNVVAAGNPCRVIRQITEEDKLYYRTGARIDPGCSYQPNASDSKSSTLSFLPLR